MAFPMPTHADEPAAGAGEPVAALPGPEGAPASRGLRLAQTPPITPEGANGRNEEAADDGEPPDAPKPGPGSPRPALKRVK
jgi:hypothetical protein